MDIARAIELGLVAASALCVFSVRGQMSRIEHRLAEMERVGVLMTSNREMEKVAKPMSARQKILWLERRSRGRIGGAT